MGFFLISYLLFHSFTYMFNVSFKPISWQRSPVGHWQGLNSNWPHFSIELLLYNWVRLYLLENVSKQIYVNNEGNFKCFFHLFTYPDLWPHSPYVLLNTIVSWLSLFASVFTVDHVIWMNCHHVIWMNCHHVSQFSLRSAKSCRGPVSDRAPHFYKLRDATVLKYFTFVIVFYLICVHCTLVFDSEKETGYKTY